MAPNMEVTFYACASKKSHHEVVTEKSVSAVCLLHDFRFNRVDGYGTSLLIPQSENNVH